MHQKRTEAQINETVFPFLTAFCESIDGSFVAVRV